MLKTTMPHIVLTRPLAASKRFSKALHARRPDVSVIISPVLAIRYYEGVTLPEAKALVLTSVHGLEAYLRLGGTAKPAFCVGQRTAREARERGFVIEAVEENLAKLGPVLETVDASNLLLVRGEHTTGQLTKSLSGLQEVIVYDQPAQGLTEEAQLALSGERSVVLPLFSPRSASELAKQIKPKAPVFAAFISEAAKKQFSSVPQKRSLTAMRPDGEAMCDATLKMLDAASALEADK